VRRTTREPEARRLAKASGAPAITCSESHTDTIAIKKPGHDRRSSQSWEGSRVLRKGDGPPRTVRCCPLRPGPRGSRCCRLAPYDVVGRAERARLAARSPYNAIHVELPVRDQSEGLDEYENAARIFRGWLDAGIVRPDALEAFYLYRMTFHDERGHLRVTTGLLGALGLDLHGAGQVLAHEQTIPKDRMDRLSLLRSTRLNTSPIWVLSLAKGLTSACREALSQAGKTSWRTTDAAGVVHEIWPMTDERRVAEITALGASAPVLIADGHHRYETACTYATECRMRNGDRPGPYDLRARFRRRALRGGALDQGHPPARAGISPDHLEDMLAPFFRIEPASRGPRRAPCYGGPRRDRSVHAQRVQAPPPASCSRAGRGRRSRCEPAQAGSGQPPRSRAHLRARMARGDRSSSRGPGGRCVPAEAGTVARIERVAYDGRRMAPKSTFFQPKPRTGMAYRSLEG